MCGKAADGFSGACGAVPVSDEHRSRNGGLSALTPAQLSTRTAPGRREGSGSGLGQAVPCLPGYISTVTATQCELAPGSEGEPAATTHRLKDKPRSLTRWAPTRQQAVHKLATPTSGPPPLPAQGVVSRLAEEDLHTHVRWEPVGEGRLSPEDGGVSGCPDTVYPEGSFSFKPRSLALIPGTSFRFTKSHRKQYKNSNFSPAKKSPNPGKHGQEILRAQRETGFHAVSSLNAG